jgi:hypothetical protein
MSFPQHILVCWSGRYSMSPDDVIGQHEEIMRRLGYAWWGKFYKENDSRPFTQLEPAEQPINGDEKYLDHIRKQIHDGVTTYLFVVNPHPSIPSIHMAQMDDVVFKMFGDLPPDRDWFKHVPAYCFKDGNPGMRQEDLRYICRHWFKIKGDLQEMDPSILDSLIDVGEERILGFSGPNFYPMLVAHKNDWEKSKENDIGKLGYIRAYVDYEFEFVNDENLRRAYRRRWREAQELFRLGKYRHSIQDLASIMELLLDEQCGCAAPRDAKLYDTIDSAIERGFLKVEKSGAIAHEIRDQRNRVHLHNDAGRPINKMEASVLLDGFSLIYKDIARRLHDKPRQAKREPS